MSSSYRLSGRAAVVVFFACGALGLGCGGSSRGGGGGGGDGGGDPDGGDEGDGARADGGTRPDGSRPGGSGPVELAEFPTRFAEASCAWQFRCCTDAELATRPGGESYDECVSTIAAFGGIAYAALSDAVADGRGRYDAENFGACLDVLASSECGEFNDAEILAMGCDEWWTPLVAVGGACENSLDCIDGDCVEGVDGVERCVEPPSIGEPCDGDCEDGAYCASDGLCADRASAGSPCEEDDACETRNCDATTGRCADEMTCTGR